MSVSSILVVIALILALLSGVDGRVPLWVAVLLLCLAMLVGSVLRP